MKYFKHIGSEYKTTFLNGLVVVGWCLTVVIKRLTQLSLTGAHAGAELGNI